MPTALAELPPATFATALLLALGLQDGEDFQIGLTKVHGNDTLIQFYPPSHKPSCICCTFYFSHPLFYPIHTDIYAQWENGLS